MANLFSVKHFTIKNHLILQNFKSSENTKLTNRLNKNISDATENTFF